VDCYAAERESKLIKLDNWRHLHRHRRHLSYKNTPAQRWFEKIRANRLSAISFYGGSLHCKIKSMNKSGFTICLEEATTQMRT
jgi:hypothetical protein